MEADPQSYPDKAPDISRIVVNSVLTNLPQTGQSTIIPQYPLAVSSADFYEGGLVNEQWFIISHTNEPPTDRIVVEGVLSQDEIAAIMGQEVPIRDDDGLGQLPFYPSLDDFVAEAFKPAYISVAALPGTMNPNKLVSFDLNLTDFEVGHGVGYDNAQDVWSQDQYWAALLVMCYQPGPSADQDPDRYQGINNTGSDGGAVEDPVRDFGVTPEDDDNASCIFLEVIRDVGMPPVEPRRRRVDLVRVIAHELGHSAGANTTGDSDHAEGGLMRADVSVEDNDFTPLTLTRFRGAPKW